MALSDRLSAWLRPAPVKAAKAITGPGVIAYQNDIPLSSIFGQEPQQRAAVFLRAYKVGWFYKAESKISRDLANLKVSVAPEDDSGDNGTDIIEPDLFTPWEQLDPIGQFLRLMERPNPNQTGRQLRQRTQIYKDMAGWGWWYLEQGANRYPGLPTAIYAISPTRLWPSYDSRGTLIGYVLDKDSPRGGTPFTVDEIVPFFNVTADDSYVYGQSVIESVYSQTTLTDQLARHTSDLLHTGGRLAGMLWPKERRLEQAEYEDAVRAWRNVASDPNAARRLLLFPEPMEWSTGAANPAEIGIPELGNWTRDEILSAFPLSPYQLGVPMPGGLNSAETRKEDRRDYWEGTMHPRVEDFEETVQVHVLSRYEAVLGSTFDFEIAEPNLDDAKSLSAKAKAMNDLVGMGFDPEGARDAAGLDHIKWVALPALKDPVAQAQAQEEARQASLAALQSGQQSAPPNAPAKSAPERASDGLELMAKRKIAAFFRGQRERVTAAIQTDYKAVRATPDARKAWAAKADPGWWNGALEDELLEETMREVYIQVGRAGLQVVADTLNRIGYNRFVGNVLADLLTYGGERIRDINARTLQALTIELAEGTRRGYSIAQLVDGVPDEGYKGVAGVTLDNGVPAFDEYRSELIARTETMLSYNRSQVTGYGEFGVTALLAYDGDGDEECADRNGQEFTIDEALAIEDHPNGTLVWSPVVDKAKHDEDSFERVGRLFVEAIKSLPQPVVPKMGDIHVHIPPTAIDNTTVVDMSDFDVDIPPANVTVNVPEQTPAAVYVDAPVVNVAPAEVTVKVPKAETPVVNVAVPEQKAPIVTVEPAVVNVNVPKTPVTVKADVGDVTVNMPAEMAITKMPDRVTSRRVTRDTRTGHITETTDVETDA